MLKKQKRVTTRLFPSHGAGKRYHSPFLTLRVVKNGGDEYPRFAFVVSKKVAKKAVERNRLKRRGYEATRTFSDDIVEPVLCIFYPKKEIHTLSFKELTAEIGSLLEKAGLIKG